MSASNLENLVAIGKLKAEAPSEVEISGLIQSARARIVDAENATLSLESRFDLAYNAAHAFALAALRKAGYRSDNRYLVFQTLQTTAQLTPAEWRVLDQAHIKRNRAEYEGIVDIDLQLVEAVIRIGRVVESRLAAS
jgi:hypothetical protein